MARIVETQEIATCQEIRRIVFVEEQGVSIDDELDGRDDEAVHFLAMVDGQPVGTARLLFPGNTGKIGRVAVLKAARGTGLGRDLILAAIEKCQSVGTRGVKLDAQTGALGFYEALGFAATGPEFMDAGIPHQTMVRDL